MSYQASQNPREDLRERLYIPELLKGLVRLRRVSAGELVWFLFLPSFEFQSSWPLDKSLSDLAGLVLEYSSCSAGSADASKPSETEVPASATRRSTSTPAMRAPPTLA